LCDYFLRLGHDLKIPDRIRTADSPWSVELDSSSPRFTPRAAYRSSLEIFSWRLFTAWEATVGGTPRL
jgi:hypothetical protein